MTDDTRVLGLAGLQALIDALGLRGYTVIGPTVRDGAIVNAPISSLDDLPRGIGDEQDAAHYRLRDRGDEALFGFAAGAQSAKPVLFQSDELLSPNRLVTGGQLPDGGRRRDRSRAGAPGRPALGDHRGALVRPARHSYARPD